MGGDDLTNQIKSFLGSNPSLTSYKAILKSVQQIKNILSNTNLSKMQKEIG